MTSTTTTADLTTEARTVVWGGPLEDFIDVGDKVGTIQLERKLGKGGHARVFRGKCSTTGAYRAVKVLHRREFLNRFTWEYKLLDRVQSPHIVRVHSFHLLPAPHYVMDFLPGCTLERYRRAQGGTIPIIEVVEIARQICEGLEHLHSIGIIHRDLTPKNVIRGPDGHITVIDLGIAKTLPEFFLDNDHIVTTSALGTPGFVAPEQEALHKLDHKVDFYGLGALVYYLLTGHKYRPQIGIKLEEEHLRIVLEQLLATDPKERYTSIDRIRDDLDVLFENFREDIPVPTVVVVQRSKFLFVLIAAILVLAAIGLWGHVARNAGTTRTTVAAMSPASPLPSTPASTPLTNPVPEVTPLSEGTVDSRPHAPASTSVPRINQSYLGPATDGNEAKLAPATFAAVPTSAKPAASEHQTKPAPSKRTRRRSKPAKTPEQKQLETKLRHALAACSVPPQKIRYHATRFGVTVNGPDIGIRHTCIEKFVPRTQDEFSGTMHFRKD